MLDLYKYVSPKLPLCDNLYDKFFKSIISFNIRSNLTSTLVPVYKRRAILDWVD